MVIKGLVFGILLWVSAYHWFIFLLFILGAVYFYFNPILNSKDLLVGFLVILFTSLILTVRLSMPIYRFAAVLSFSFLWVLLLGIKNLIFINRQKIYYLLNSFLLLSIFLIFFYADKSRFFTLKYLAAGAAVFFLLEEFFRIFRESIRQNLILGRRYHLLAVTIGFLGIQLLWVIALLPVGFINASALMLLSILTMENFSLHYLDGSINRRLVLRDITVFLLFGLIIIGISSWKL